MNKTKFANYSDDGTPYTSGQNIGDAIRTLENDSVRLFKWFSNNQNGSLPLSNKERVTMKRGETEIKSSNCEKLPGIEIGGNLVLMNIQIIL